VGRQTSAPAPRCGLQQQCRGVETGVGEVWASQGAAAGAHTTGAQGHCHCICNLVDAALQPPAGVCVEADVLGIGTHHLQPLDEGHAAACMLRQGAARWPLALRTKRVRLGARLPVLKPALEALCNISIDPSTPVACMACTRGEARTDGVLCTLEPSVVCIVFCTAYNAEMQQLLAGKVAVRALGGGIWEQRVSGSLRCQAPV
jgi:hypothetical protein